MRLPSGEGKRSRQRMSPAQAGKPCVIAISRNPFRIGFNGQRGKVCVGHKGAFCACRSAQTVKYLPVPLARGNPKAGIVLTQLACIIERAFDGCRIGIDSRMRDNPDERGKCQFRDSEAFAGIHRIFKPPPIPLVIPGIIAMGINENVNVEEDQ